MKKILMLVFACSVLCQAAYPAQVNIPASDAGRQTLLSEGGPSGGFGDFKIKIWPCIPAGVTGLVFEGGGGAIFNKKLYFGGYAGALISSIDSAKVKAGKTGILSLGYGGVKAGYIFNPDDVNHFSVNSFIGAGTLGYKQSDGSITDNRTFFMVEPGADWEINVATNLKLGLGISYRLLLGITDSGTGITDAAGSGFNAVASLSFGKF